VNEIGISRRSFCTLLGALAGSPPSRILSEPMQHVETGQNRDIPPEPEPTLERLSPWMSGQLDIHHISTGRGNCTFIIGPDSSTFMIDCGAVKYGNKGQYLISAKPDDSRRPGEWIARYVARHLAPTGRECIDTFLLTHFHDDHMGEMPGPLEPPRPSKFGDYQLTGICDVAEVIRVGRVVDRGHPTYDYPIPQNFPHMDNYRRFLNALKQRGGRVERFTPGSRSQLALTQNPTQYETFSIQNLAANGQIWTGVGSETRSIFPSLSSVKPEDYPTENKCSVGIRLSYGRFDYLSVGDMDHEVRYGRWPWGDIESEVARTAGPVDVAVAAHHGYVNACGPDWVRALRPRVFVIPAWNQGHPAMPAIQNMLSKDLYPGARDIFSTGFRPESKIAVAEIQKMQSDNGHVIIRVPPPGNSFEVIVTTNSDESDRIVRRFGPYECS
jgi:beta-lactamase superfamily II metal-dependent hydrolase